MTYPNGQLPASLRVRVLGSSVSTLPVDAAACLELAVEAFTIASGVSVGINQGYRELGTRSDDPWLSPATQWSVFNKMNQVPGSATAAPPGTSNHGEDGTDESAADLNGPVAQYDTAARRQFTTIAGRYGWIPDRVRDEPWHWEWQRNRVAPDVWEDIEMSQAADNIIAAVNANTNKRADALEAQLRRVRGAVVNLIKTVATTERKRDKSVAAALDKLAAELDAALKAIE